MFLSLLLITVSSLGLTEAVAATPSVSLIKGALQVRTPAGPVLTNVRLRLRLADGASLAGTLEEAGRENARDGAGEFERMRYKFKPAPPAQESEGGGPLLAVLEVRRYSRTGVLVASLEYSGPPLAATDGVQLLVGFDAFARGMALKQLKLYWTAPVFVSDHRLLSPSNQLLLWKQMRGVEDFHLMVPLAGGGMVSTIGVADIEYRYEFRVASSSYDATLAPRRVPLFAYASGSDPYKLPRETYETAFASEGQYGRLRWEKSYPEVFRWLGWCSWNTYYHEVSEEKVIRSVRSLRERNIPFGFVLVDDGWLSVKENKLSGFDADASRFPRGMSGLAKTLREEYRVAHVGVWHTFQGYWDGVNKSSDFASRSDLYTGVGGKSLPDPRDGRGEGFYSDWYSRLKSWGYDFVKVDGQSNIIKFTNGLLPLFDSGRGEQRNLQEAAAKTFGDRAAANEKSLTPGLNVINCMEMTLEHAFNWRLSNVARNSDDYSPDSPQNAKEHVHQNAYNAYWTSNFAYPDWDMFQSHDPSAEFHAVARAVSGGPIYFTDEPGKENPEILRRLAFSDGRLLMADEPAQVTRDVLLTDTSLEAVPLKVFARVTRPGLTAGVVAAFNVNKHARSVEGMLRASDAEAPAAASQRSAVAVYSLSDGRAVLLDARHTSLTFALGEFGQDLFTLAPVERGVAVFGLLDKYLSPASVVSVSHHDNDATTVRLREAGEFGAWLESEPLKVEVDGRALAASDYSYAGGLLRVPVASFGASAGEREIRIVSARASR